MAERYRVVALAGRGGMGEVHRGLARKKEWLAAIVVVLVAASTNTGGDYPIVKFATAALMWLSIVPILRRYGLLALVVGLVVQNVLLVFPLTSHLARWYAPVGLAGIFVIAAVGVYGFYTSLGANRSSQRPRSIIRPRRPLSVLSLSGNPFPARVSGRQVASPIPPGSTVSCSQPAAPSP